LVEVQVPHPHAVKKVVLPKKVLESDVLVNVLKVVVVVACRFVDLDPLMVGHLRLVSEDRNEKLETFMKKIDVVEPQN
jgi:hypothetical protein